MDNAELHSLITLGENTLITKYFTLAGTTVVIWDYLLTFSDELRYVWKREKSWSFWVFIISRYSILLFKTWDTICAVFPYIRSGKNMFTDTFQRICGPDILKRCECMVNVHSQEGSNLGRKPRCNRTIKLEGYYFVFIITIGQIYLTMRVYALTEASKYVLSFFGILVTSSLATGLWLCSIPSARAVQMPEIHLDPFRTCIFSASETAEWAYRSQVAFADLVTFVCIIVFVLKLKAKHGRPHMSRLMRTILQDGVMYFFVMATFHIAIAFFTFFIPPSARGFPPIAIIVLIPIMISRLVISLRKAADASLVQAWNEDHFTALESGEHQMIDFANPQARSPATSSRPAV